MAELSGAAPPSKPKVTKSQPRLATNLQNGTRTHRLGAYSKKMTTTATTGGTDRSQPIPTPNRAGQSSSGDRTSAAQLDEAIAGFSPHLQQRVTHFEKKLKQFALNLADPSSRARTNRTLAAEPFANFVEYYLANPQLAKYTVKQDLQRLDYKVVPHG